MGPETTIIETTTLSQPAIEVEAVTEIPVEASLETVTQISIEEWKRLKSLEVETSTEPFIKIALKCSPVKCLPLNPASNRALSPVELKAISSHVHAYVNDYEKYVHQEVTAQPYVHDPSWERVRTDRHIQDRTRVSEDRTRVSEVRIRPLGP